MNTKSSVKTPIKYQKIIDDLKLSYDFIYLDALTFIILWRQDKKLTSKDAWIGGGNRSLFRKFVATVIERFYERCVPDEKVTRWALGLGFDFADWILKQPLDFKLQLPHHAEMGEYELPLDNCQK